MTGPMSPRDDFTALPGNNLISGTFSYQKRSSSNRTDFEVTANDLRVTVEDMGDDADGQPPASLEGQAKAASEDANLRNIWDDAMKDFGLAGKPHREVAVLMISWNEKLDDLNTTVEVNALERVFKDLFNYKVVKREIVGDENHKRPKNPGFQVSKHLIEFVDKYDSESSLLIVYYAGHGIPGKPGELHLAGQRQPNQKHSARNAAAWHDSEHIIRHAVGDVLLIFDCCYAGNLLSHDTRSYYPTRSYETLAACGRREVTNPPGQDSFTSALIWALKELVKDRKRFTITELQTKIMNGAPDFPKGQFVPLLERHEPCDQRLILAPLPIATDADSPVSTISNHVIDLPQNYLDLRFWFTNRPDEEEIKNLAMRLRRDMMDKHIGARSIVWLGLKNVPLMRSEMELARPVIEKWKSRMQSPSRKSSFHNPCTNDSNGLLEAVLCSPTPPVSHSSQSSISEGHLEQQEATEGMERFKHNIIPANGTAKKGNHHSKRGVDPEASNGTMNASFRNTMMYAIRSIYPVIKVVFVLSLTAGAWHKKSTLPWAEGAPTSLGNGFNLQHPSAADMVITSRPLLDIVQHPG